MAVARRPDRDIDEEADFYARKTNERAYIGEAYNGATRDWAIVDVPPGTNRVKMDGVGGASQEVTWQRYNGVRRSRFNPKSDSPAPSSSSELNLRKFVGVRPKTDTMWTEITKDLVVKDAIDKLGYEYEETEFFYYIMEYLRYVRLPTPFIPSLTNKIKQEDVLRLVKISDDIRARRRERIRQIEWEKKMPPAPRPFPRPHIEEPRTPRMIQDRGWDEERIVERDFYERRSPRNDRENHQPFPRPPMPPPLPQIVQLSGPGASPRGERVMEREREKVVVIR